MAKTMIERSLEWASSRSPWVLMFNTGSCGGCDLEIRALSTPGFNGEWNGIQFANSPRQADILICTGPVTLQCKDKLIQIYEQMPEPKRVIAVGACACSGSIYHDCYGICGSVDQVIPVDVYVPGCAADPQTILDAIRKLSEIDLDADDEEDSE